MGEIRLKTNKEGKLLLVEGLSPNISSRFYLNSILGSFGASESWYLRTYSKGLYRYLLRWTGDGMGELFTVILEPEAPVVRKVYPELIVGKLEDFSELIRLTKDDFLEGL
jgi:hypothetical protein